MASHIVPTRSCWISLLAVCLVLAAYPGCAANAQDREFVKTVEVVGRSLFSESDPAVAREKAIANSLGAAVIQVATEEIEPDIFTRSAQKIRTTLLADTQRYIQSYRVLEEVKSDKDYQVMVQAVVSVRQITTGLRRAGILRTAATLPTVLFLTSQQNLTDVLPQYWWSGTVKDAELVAENAMIQTFREQGFEVIDRRAPGILATAASQRYTPNPDDRAAADIGLQLGADVVVVGLSTAQAIPESTADVTHSFNATAIVRALEIPSAAFLAATTESFSAEDADDRAGGVNALTGAGANAGRRLAALLQPAWLNRKKERSVLRLEVEGTRALAQFVRFRKILKTIQGVRDMQIEILRPDQAVIAVDFDGNTQTLAAKLMGNTDLSSGIDIYDLSSEGLKVKLTRAPGTI